MAKATQREISSVANMAKKPERVKVKDGDPFDGQQGKKNRTQVRYYAVRKIRGPGKHAGYKTFKAHDESDAKRQWFNMTGTSQRSHAFNLQVVELDRNHPSVKDAINVPHPVNPEGGTTLSQMMDQDFSEVQGEIARGGRKEPGPPVQPATAE